MLYSVELANHLFNAEAFFMFLAEREGFEPPEVLPSTVFKTAAIDHSAISPLADHQLYSGLLFLRVVQRYICFLNYARAELIFLAFNEINLSGAGVQGDDSEYFDR